ncbi:MAG: hemolysin family protein [Chloroflexi bacterium]|nr:hemolysin family protein [Chloroflexota bacterium]
MLSKLLVNFLLLGTISYGVASVNTAAEGGAGLVAWLIPLLVIALLIALNGLYVSAEFAIIGTRPSQMEEIARQGDPAAEHVMQILDDPRRQDQYIATAQLGITIASLGLGMYAEPALEHLLAPYLTSWFDLEAWATLFGSTAENILHLLGYVLVISVITYLHVVVGEMVPKSIALSHAPQTALKVNPYMRVSYFSLTYLVRLLNALGAILLRLLRLRPPKSRVHSPQELEQLVTESAEGGFINDDERDIIHNIFNFGERYAAQVMTPRRKVQAIPVDIPEQELLNLVVNSNHNRFPVYQDSLDHVIGILHMQNLIKHSLLGKGSFDLRLLLNPAPAVPEDTAVEDLLTVFKQQHIHMAIVLDEFGGMAGVVTLEDLVEEVVGEVQDEFDVEHEPYVEISPGVLELAGTYLLAHLIEDVSLGDEDELPEVETVGGLVVTALGRPPQVGDELLLNENIHFKVLAIDGLAIARLQVTFPAGEG